jgi:predicted transcriptional regulator
LDSRTFDESRARARTWTFLSRHALVLLAIAQDPARRIREIASEVGVTERSTYRILLDLVDGGYVRRRRLGRRNTCEVYYDLPIGDGLVDERAIADLCGLVAARAPRRLADESGFDASDRGVTSSEEAPPR